MDNEGEGAGTERASNLANGGNGGSSDIGGGKSESNEPDVSDSLYDGFQKLTAGANVLGLADLGRRERTARSGIQFGE